MAASFFIGTLSSNAAAAVDNDGGDDSSRPVIDYKQFQDRIINMAASFEEEQVKSHRIGDRPLLYYSTKTCTNPGGARTSYCKTTSNKSQQQQANEQPPITMIDHDGATTTSGGGGGGELTSSSSSSVVLNAERVIELLFSSDNNNGLNGEPKQLFCELEELNDGVWYEAARWVRFEEDVEIGGDRWSKPFVAAISLHALFELRHYLSTGLILLDVDVQSFSQLIALVTNSLIETRQLDSDLRDRFIETLQLRHVHQYEHSGPILKRGISGIGKKITHWRIDESSAEQPQQENNNNNNNESSCPNLHPPSPHSLTVNASSSPSISPPSPTTPTCSSVRQNESFAKKLAPGSEASASLIGGVDYLRTTVAAFVRLSSNKTTFHECSEVAIPTRFIFVLMGPTPRAKDLRQVGRAMETLMCDDIFRDFAYRSANRQDLLTGFDEFLDQGIALPPSEWDPNIRIEPPKRIPSVDERKMSVLTQTLSEKSLSICSFNNNNNNVPPPISRGISENSAITTPQSNKTLMTLETITPPRPLTPNSESLNAFMDELLKKQAEVDNNNNNNNNNKGNDESGSGQVHSVDPELLRTGRVFGGLAADFWRRWTWLANGSDITDAFNVQCVASVFFLFFACLAPIVTFGGLLGLATDNHMAAFESILTAAVCGTTYHVFAGQPLTIIGSTGPVLLFEKILFTFAKDNEMNYLTLRFWIGLWAAAYLMVAVALDLSALVQLITRFTEECFATLISVIFIFEAFVALSGIYVANPISNKYNAARNYSCQCDWVQSNYSAAYSLDFDQVPSTTTKGINRTAFDCRLLDVTKCVQMPPCRPIGPGCGLRPPVPDVFFFSVLIALGTCALSFALKYFRTSPYFSSKVRTVVSDFAVSISIVLMVATDFFVALPTPKLTVPREFAPTRPDRRWLVSPFANPTWTLFAAPLPAFLLAVLLFMDQQITAVIVNRREHKLVKGKGYHLDLFVLTWHVVFCASFGLPYFVAATVLAITHVTSLRKQSETSAPGEQPRFLGLIEQRVTGFMVFVLIGCAIPLRGVLKFIPMPVLYGVFLYMGLSALQTSQFYQRCLLVFMPVKYQPDAPYLRHMRTWRVHLFTAVQLTAFIVLWVIKQTKEISILFILMLVCMVFLRKMLDYVFSQDELRWVDDILPKNPLAVAAKKDDDIKKKLPDTIIQHHDNNDNGNDNKPVSVVIKTDNKEKNRSSNSLLKRFRRANNGSDGAVEECCPLQERNLCPPPTIVVVSPSREASTDDLTVCDTNNTTNH